MILSMLFLLAIALIGIKCFRKTPVQGFTFIFGTACLLFTLNIASAAVNPDTAAAAAAQLAALGNGIVTAIQAKDTTSLITIVLGSVSTVAWIVHLVWHWISGK